MGALGAEATALGREVSPVPRRASLVPRVCETLTERDGLDGPDSNKENIETVKGTPYLKSVSLAPVN